jgi:hypothetical protein
MSQPSVVVRVIIAAISLGVAMYRATKTQETH